MLFIWYSAGFAQLTLRTLRVKGVDSFHRKRRVLFFSGGKGFRAFYQQKHNTPSTSMSAFRTEIEMETWDSACN